MIIPLLKLRIAYIKRKPIKNMIIIFLPVILSFFLSLISNSIIDSFGGKSELKPTNYDYINSDFDLIKITDTKYLGKTVAIISEDDSIRAKMYDEYFKYSKGNSTILNFSTYYDFIEYINSNQYNETNITFDSVFQVDNDSNGRKYKFKNNMFSFDSVLSLENKLKFPKGNISEYFNPYFLLASLVEQSLGNIPSTNLVVSQQILKRRPQYNIYSS
jgi:hypothetical protein